MKYGENPMAIIANRQLEKELDHILFAYDDMEIIV